MVEVHSLLDFNASDIPKGKPPDQCLDDHDNFIMKQSHFNKRIQSQLHNNSLAIKSLLDVLGRTVNDVKCLVKHFHIVQTQLLIMDPWSKADYSRLIREASMA